MARHCEFRNEFVWLAKTADAGLGLARRGMRDITGGADDLGREIR